MEPTASSFSPPRHRDPPPPTLLPAISIRAPLSSDDADEGYATTSGSEPDTPTSGSDDADEPDAAPPPALPRSGSMPVAPLTDDQDGFSFDEEEEEDPLFSVVARVLSFVEASPSPSEEPMQVKPVILVEDPKQESELGDEADEADISLDSETAGLGACDVSTLKADSSKATKVDEILDRGSLDEDDLKKAENPVHYSDVLTEPESESESVSASSPNYGAKDEKVITELEQPSDESGMKSNKSNIELAAETAVKISIKEERLQVHHDEVSTTICIGREIDRSPIAAENCFHSVDDGETMGSSEEMNEEEDSASDEHVRIAILDSSEAVIQVLKQREEASSSSRYYSHSTTEREIVLASDEEDASSGEAGEELFDPAKFATFLQEMRDSNPNDNMAGSGMFQPSLEPTAPRKTQPLLSTSSKYAVTTGSADILNEGERKLHEQIESIRIKFLRLILRLGYSPNDPVPAKVLHDISRAEAMRLGVGNATWTFSFESAREKAMELEMEGKTDSEFSCYILVIGKGGVGKSATINSIFGEEKSPTDPFKPETSSVKEIVGIVDGMKIRVLDTPGLKPSFRDQASNMRILSSVKKCIKRCPPDVILYVDRIDTQSGGFNDLPLLRTVSSVFGSSIWSKTIITLTHAASVPPDSPSGSQLTYNFSLDRMSSLVRKVIQAAVGQNLMNPIALVENHPLCRRNTQGLRVLPNGSRWVPHLLLLSYSSKIISEISNLPKIEKSSFGNFFKVLSARRQMPFILSSLLQEKDHPKLPPEQGGELDVDLDDFLDQEEEDLEHEYDQLPPFRPLKKSEMAKLTKLQKRTYFEEYDYRKKLLKKKMWQQEIRRLKEIKKRGKDDQNRYIYEEFPEDAHDGNTPASVEVPLPDRELPTSFDCDNPVYLYRSLEGISQLSTRPLYVGGGWDHEWGLDGVNFEKSIVLTGRFPVELSAQAKKDKEDFYIHLESLISAKHRESGSTLASFEFQRGGNQVRAFIFRGETKMKNWKKKKNKTTAVVTMTFLDDNVATGMKIQDQLSIGKRVTLSVGTGAVRAQDDVAYGAILEATLREKDHPIDKALSTLGLSLINCNGALAVAANLNSHISLGRNSKMMFGVSLNDRKTGRITLRTSGSEQFHIVFAFVPIALSALRRIFFWN